jgi:HEAT repeat protein
MSMNPAIGMVSASIALCVCTAGCGSQRSGAEAEHQPPAGSSASASPPKDREVVEHATKLRDADPEVRAKAASALSKMGARGATAVGDVAAGDSDEPVRLLALSVLEQLGPDAAGAVPVLTDLLSDPALDVRVTASVVLGKIGPKAEPAVSRLIAAAKDANFGVRMSAVTSLGQIHADAAEVVPVLVEAINDANPEVRQLGIVALEGYGEEAAPAVPALVEVLKSPTRDAADRNLAVTSLSMIGKPAIAALKNLGDESDPQVRILATLALTLIASPESIPLIVDRLTDSDSQVRQNAESGLLLMAERAVPALEAAAKDPDETKRAAAAQMLARLKK